MNRLRVIFACNQKISRSGLALILSSLENLEVVGEDGDSLLKGALKLQPDLVIYKLLSTTESEYLILKQLRSLCCFTKLIIFTPSLVERESIKRFLQICDGFLQGPILPGQLLKAIEFSYYSTSFLFLGSAKHIRPVMNENTGSILPLDFVKKNKP